MKAVDGVARPAGLELRQAAALEDEHVVGVLGPDPGGRSPGVPGAAHCLRPVGDEVVRPGLVAAALLDLLLRPQDGGTCQRHGHGGDHCSRNCALHRFCLLASVPHVQPFTGNERPRRPAPRFVSVQSTTSRMSGDRASPRMRTQPSPVEQAALSSRARPFVHSGGLVPCRALMKVSACVASGVPGAAAATSRNSASALSSSPLPA